MRKTYLTLFLLVISPLLSLANTQYTPSEIRAAVRQAGGPESFIRQLASGTAKMAGQMIDDQTQITGAIATERTLVYYIRHINYVKSDVSNTSAFRQKIATRNAPLVCTAPVASILINEYGAGYKYMVYSKTREYLFDYTLNKATCSPNYRW
jgi:hypothetical protein